MSVLFDLSGITEESNKFFEKFEKMWEKIEFQQKIFSFAKMQLKDFKIFLHFKSIPCEDRRLWKGSGWGASEMRVAILNQILESGKSAQQNRKNLEYNRHEGSTVSWISKKMWVLWSVNLMKRFTWQIILDFFDIQNMNHSTFNYIANITQLITIKCHCKKWRWLSLSKKSIFQKTCWSKNLDRNETNCEMDGNDV